MAIKKNCHWYREILGGKNNWCNALECLQCEKGQCSFYETDEEYTKRQKDFADKRASKSKNKLK